MKVWLCRVFGHKWRHNEPLTMEERKPYRDGECVSRVMQHRYCWRCGEPNPSYRGMKEE